jgi:hypothetical protein
VAFSVEAVGSSTGNSKVSNMVTAHRQYRSIMATALPRPRDTRRKTNITAATQAALHLNSNSMAATVAARQLVTPTLGSSTAQRLHPDSMEALRRLASTAGTSRTAGLVGTRERRRRTRISPRVDLVGMEHRTSIRLGVIGG